MGCYPHSWNRLARIPKSSSRSNSRSRAGIEGTREQVAFVLKQPGEGGCSGLPGVPSCSTRISRRCEARFSRRSRWQRRGCRAACVNRPRPRFADPKRPLFENPPPDTACPPPPPPRPPPHHRLRARLAPTGSWRRPCGSRCACRNGLLLDAPSAIDDDEGLTEGAGRIKHLEILVQPQGCSSLLRVSPDSKRATLTMDLPESSRYSESRRLPPVRGLRAFGFAFESSKAIAGAWKFNRLLISTPCGGFWRRRRRHAAELAPTS